MPILFRDSRDPVTVYLSDDTEPRTAVQVRPLTQREMERAREVVGPPPYRGLRVVDAVYAAEATSRGDALAALDDEDRLAFHAALRWQHDEARAVLAAGLVSVDGEPCTGPELEDMCSTAVATTVVIELAARVKAVSNLDPKARGTYAQRCGSTGTTDDAGGLARGATDAPKS